MEKVIDKHLRSDIFNDKYFLRIEDNVKHFVQDKQVNIKVWEMYNIGDEYYEQ